MFAVFILFFLSGVHVLVLHTLVQVSEFEVFTRLLVAEVFWGGVDYITEDSILLG